MSRNVEMVETAMASTPLTEGRNAKLAASLVSHAVRIASIASMRRQIIRAAVCGTPGERRKLFGGTAVSKMRPASAKSKRFFRFFVGSLFVTTVMLGNVQCINSNAYIDDRGAFWGELAFRARDQTDGKRRDSARAGDRRRLDAPRSLPVRRRADEGLAGSTQAGVAELETRIA